MNRSVLNTTATLNRRQFLGGALTVAASASTLATLSGLAAESASQDSKPVELQRKIKLGVIGNGGRGAWIAKLFQKHGGYEMHAVADYFQEVADKCGDELGVDRARRFSTLSGYKKLIESRLQGLVWVNDIALGCDFIGNFDIHAIDAAIWALGRRPVIAMGSSRVCRPTPHGDSRDVCSVVFAYADGLVHNHFGQGLRNQVQDDLSCRIYGQNGQALINYWGKATMRSFDDAYNGEVVNLYEAGARRNIAAFYQNITESRFENETVPRAVDGVLTCILGREAAARHSRLTMAELLQENQRLDVDLRGLKT